MHADTFADGLTRWLRGSDSCEAEAASILFAETVLLARAWIRAQQKER